MISASNLWRDGFCVEWKPNKCSHPNNETQIIDADFQAEEITQIK